MQAVFMKVVTKKEWKRKTVLNWCSIFHWQKARNRARPPEKINIFRSCVWLFLLDFAQTEIACWNYMLIKSARTVSCELYWEIRVYIGLTSVTGRFAWNNSSRTQNKPCRETCKLEAVKTKLTDFNQSKQTIKSADLTENDYPMTITSSNSNKNITKRQRKSQDISSNELTPTTTTEVINQMRGARTCNEKGKTRTPTSTWRCLWLWSQPIIWGLTNSNQLEHLK